MTEGDAVGDTGFRYTEHTADAGFVAWAPTLGGALEQAAKALLGLVCDPVTVKPTEDFPIDVSAEDEEELLYAFLAELLFMQDSHGVLLGGVEVRSVQRTATGLRLRGRTLGEPYDPGRHVLVGGVKAPTYHKLAVRHRPGVVEVQAVVDV